MPTEIHPRGYWIGATHHYFDRPLAAAIADLVGDGTVVDLGCGNDRGSAHYVNHWRASGIQAVGYDGNPTTLERVADLSVPQELGAWDWVVSLEVGEHIPARWQDAYLDNVARHATHGIVLSWAVPGQGGRGHVNERANAWVIDRMTERHWQIDWPASHALRRVADLPWFGRTLMVFGR